MNFPMTAANSMRNVLLLDIMDILASSVCVLPLNPNSPSHILSGSSPNNWPEILNSQIAGMQESGLHTFEAMVDAMLLGNSMFRARSSKLHLAASNALLTALSLHFRTNYASPLYRDAVVRFCASLNDNLQKRSSGSSYSADVLVTLVRCMLQLVFSGEFRYEFIAPCMSFLRSCSSGSSRGGSKIELIVAAFNKIVQACIPALDPRNHQPFHIVWLPRVILEFALNFSGNAVAALTLDSMVFDAAPTVGWCSLRTDQPDGSSQCVSLHCGAVLAALRRTRQPVSLDGIAATAKIPAREVSTCVNTLSSMGLVQSFSDGSVAAADEKFSGQFTGMSLNAAGAHQVPREEKGCFISPVSTTTVAAYIRTCHFILLRLIRCKEGTAEAQLIADVSQEESVSANDVHQCIYFLISRAIVRIVATGSISFIFLAVDSSPAAPAFLPFASPDSDSASFGFGLSDAGISKVVAFTPCDMVSDDSAGDMLSSIMLAMHPASCAEFSTKAAAEHYLTLAISQLQNSLGISFLLAAKELIECHGFPERAIIKYLDVSVYSQMYPNATAFRAQAHGGVDVGNTVVDVSAPADAATHCCVCLDSESPLIQLPCSHLLCEHDFAHYFLSDIGQHTFGTLPEEQTPVAAALDEDGNTPRRRDFFSCPVCQLSLSDQFWQSFPDYLVEAQRDRPASSQVTLDHVHRRIVANALRRLRQDPSSTIARCEGSKGMKGRYVVAASAKQAIVCMGRSFDCVGDFRDFTDGTALPPCGLSSLQLSQWKQTVLAVNAEVEKSQASQVNRAGIPMKRSAETGLLYVFRAFPHIIFVTICTGTAAGCSAVQ